jgi:hypothetical protein
MLLYFWSKKSMDEKTFIKLHRRQRESGLTVKEFCSNEVIAPSTFYHWQKKLKRLGRLPGFIPVIVDTSPGLSQDKFTDRHFSSSLVPPEESGVVPIEIEYPNKTIIRIKNGLDLSLLKALISLNL